MTSSDGARRDFTKEEAAAQYAHFCVELQNLEHQCSKGDVVKTSAEPILVCLKFFKEYMKGILTSSLPAVIDPLNSAVEEVNTHRSIDLNPILSVNCHSLIDWALYDKYIFPAGDHKIVKNESGRICGLLVPVLVLPDESPKVRAICKCPQHALRAKKQHSGRYLQMELPCQRQRAWKQGEEPQMPDRVLARWLVEGASHDSTAKHMASRYH